MYKERSGNKGPVRQSRTCKGRNNNGTVISYRYWAQVVQVNDPWLPTRARVEVDLVQEWVQGVEPGNPTIRFQRQMMRRQERRERRELLRLQQQQVAEAVAVTSNDAAAQTEPLELRTIAASVDDGRYYPTCGKRRDREEEEGSASPPYSRTRWSTEEDDRRYYPRARTGGQAPSSSTDAQLQGGRQEEDRRRAIQGPQMSPFHALTSGAGVRMQAPATVARDPCRRYDVNVPDAARRGAQ